MPGSYPGPLHILRDTGAPVGAQGDVSSDYTTIVLIHGFAWHSEIFTPLIARAPQHNARIVLLNRRDYRGATPYAPDELAVLQAATVAEDTHHLQATLRAFMAARAREVYDFLGWFVGEHHIPPACPNSENAKEGGIVLAAWSFGTVLTTALLANIATFPASARGVELRKYVRRIIFYDPPYLALGFPPMPEAYNPLSDPTIAPKDATRAFAAWVSGYYAHPSMALDSDPDENPSNLVLERRTPLEAPPPTLFTLTEAEREAAFYPGPGDPGGSDTLLLLGGLRSGLFAALREGALLLPQGYGVSVGKGAGEETDAWPSVEVKYVWCDQWEVPWGVWNMRARVREGREAGEPLRPVTFLRVREANHFVHSDDPERALRALLSIDTADIV
ncbi:hypothetical protein C8Q74DRAFT_1305448 [Fomes fomentarius]|nr:hypothetical protein C8Q74DRAFT_1305448 [Fomes fomentarius]